MSVLKCKMCGGSMEIQPGQSVAVCEYCGTKQTLPKLDNERKANLYDRAGHFRRNNEFDRAIGIYEQILAADDTDAESYWSLVLCRYGIEYVEDPATRKRIPTVNRTQTTSIFSDEDYLAALRHADDYQRSVYEAEAAVIDKIQTGILAVSQQEAPFDVFICYKESDYNGRRTVDSVLAMDLYKELTAEGYRVFFSRVTLEDKLGTAYEPYIFAALNSAKVMIVVGTRPEHFNAVWVKNEWSRYLALIRGGAKKYLIPAYRDMDPYDLPEEFSHLQAQDMSKLGFLQDLVRGVQKLIGTKAPMAASDNSEQLLKRAFLALEDGDWKQADAFCEQALNQNAENPKAYLAKLMAELQVRQEADLAHLKKPFDSHPLYQKVLRFGDGLLVSRLQGYNDAIRQAARQAVKAAEASAPKEKAALGGKKKIIGIAATVLVMVAAVVILLLNSSAKKAAAYEEAAALLTGGAYREAAAAYGELGTYKDSAQRMAEAEEKAAEAEAAAAAAERERQLAAQYDAAVQLLEEREYSEAVEVFTELGDYRDAAEQLKTAQEGVQKSGEYNTAAEVMAAGNYEAAIALWERLGDFSDSQEQLEICKVEILHAKFRSCIDGVEAVEYDAAADCLIALSAHQHPLASEYQDQGYWELAKLAFAEEKAAEAELFLGSILHAEQFSDFDRLLEDARLLKIYQEAQAIKVKDSDTKAALQSLIDQLPEDYPGREDLQKEIKDYEKALEEKAKEPIFISRDIIAGTWQGVGSNGTMYTVTFQADGKADILFGSGQYFFTERKPYYIKEIDGAWYLTVNLFGTDMYLTEKGGAVSTVPFSGGSVMLKRA